MSLLQNSNAISSGSYDINNSLRFRSSASAYLSRTPASAGNRRTWTWSGWVKRGSLTSFQNLFSAQYVAGGSADAIRFSTTDTLALFLNDGTSAQINSTQVFRDPSAWYHIVAAVDTTQATASNRLKLYVNGSQITAFGTATYPTQNFDCGINNNVPHSLGNYITSPSQYFDGYMTEVNFIDGSAKTPSDFGETDTTTGVWKPKAYTGTYGTNGFYLKFSDIATTSGSNAGLGKDFSGNTNYWNTNNINLNTPINTNTSYDAMTDVPTNTSATVANYAVMNPLNAISTTGGNTTTLSNANLSVLMPNTAGSRTAFATIGVSSGKWYWETTITTGSINTYYPGLGIDTNLNALPTDQSGGTASGYMYLSNGQKFNNGSLTAYGSSFTTNDVIGVALDMDAGTITFYKNNTSQGQAFSGITGTAVPCVVGQNNAALAINFGQRPFSYTPPTGFVALNTYNLPDSTIKKGNSYMDATLYTGNGSTNTITNAGAFKPDMVWIKSRSYAENNWEFDSVRGVNIRLSTNQTIAEATGTNQLNSFNSNGFSLGADGAGQVNANAQTYVAWQWQAGQGSTSSNTSGSITSTVSVNTTAGFSIVTWTGTGANATVGHGLGVAPKMVIVKNRTTAGDEWCVWHTSLTNATYYLYLNGTAAQAVDTTFWNSTAPSSTVISLGSNGRTNRSSSNMVCYAWAEIAGFSKFGSYTGNGSTDGPFQYCGFRPRWIMWKRTSSTSNWIIWDTARNTYNAVNTVLFPDTSDAESTNTAYDIDVLSNGFKMRTSNATLNGSGSTYIFAAFAENPLKNSLAR